VEAQSAARRAKEQQQQQQQQQQRQQHQQQQGNGDPPPPFSPYGTQQHGLCNSALAIPIPENGAPLGGGPMNAAQLAQASMLWNSMPAAHPHSGPG